MPLVPSFLLLLLACPALLTLSGSQSLQTGGQRAPRNTKPEGGGQPIKVVISEACVQGDSSQNQGKELDLEPGSPLVLTHRIRLVPGSCGGGCEAEFAALRDRLERLEKEVSALREKCGGPEGGCCTSQQSKGTECSIKPEGEECPNECSDQGRCEDGKCVCFPGFSGPDCSLSDCPGNCNDKGKCVNGQCVCDPGFTGPDCSSESCPGNCNNKGRCENGQCVCNTGFTGLDCSTKACPGNCNNKGQCVNGKCVCKTGFTGPDCSTKACPGNCNNKGQCVNGKCVCDSSFTGPDCSSESCPGNCNNKGQCVNGKCVCDSSFTGPDCSSESCPGNCNNKGRCENGQCVCNTGFTGLDCSTKACPGNCNNKGRCENGQCVCNTGFTGLDCSTKACPGNCNNKGQCVNGKCVCDSSFTGPDCSTKSCPGNCSNRGKCVNGQCVCDSGFTGPDCSAKACPNNCSNKGRCVSGKCVCEVGFSGQDCAAKGCPDNCSNKGRCVKGRCVCRRGFAIPDCSQCEAGFTGADCGTAMSGVSQLNTKDVTESSVTLFWTPPPVQYDTYHVTFASQKEGDQQITSQVGGKLTAYTQTGLAAGQAYTVTINGEIDGRMGAESTAEFTTLISGPTNLQVVKTTTTSAVVQWEQSQGDIDRYRLTVTPNQTDGTAKGRQDLTLPPERDSAQIDGLDPGHLYDITLVAEKGGIESKPATVQVTPGPELPSGLVFSEVTETSLSVSWTKPKSPVSGFKVTYTHTQEGEPVSVMVDSGDSTLALSKLSPGSSYEVSVISVLGLDESDAIKDLVMTLPDPPTTLQAINVTDTKALLLWRPALATVDRYVIVYGSEKGSDDVKITVSGNAAEQQLKDLQGSTMYTVTVTSQLGNLDGPAAITVFTTTSGSGGDGEVPRDLKASQVTPRSALLTWKPPSAAVGSYKLTYQTEGQEMQEVTIDSTVTEFKLTRLHPMSKYTVQLQGERGGSYTAAISTEFTTGNLRYPFPSDCSQELLNGMHESGEVEIFPNGRQGKPVLVYCDQVTDGGGWTVFQRRMDGKTDFFQGWENYSKGFGELSGEFWLGNENLHNLTSMAPMTLRVDLRAGDESVFAKYSAFTVDTVRKNYALKVSGYSGTAGDSMSYHNGRMFSTRDRDPAPFITRCAMSYRGGWWYKNCHQANLNGLYDTNVNHQGLIWTAWKGKDYSVPFTEMKLRPTSFTPPTQG
ncbi:tenascin-X-like isoform X3 [Oncorhynchus tshawytscha]|uniref:tenascin-X-like isoform X3 n=1 Tax=Oncorhynchus tshawytscha TaxID=74940 RepID=UPI001C3E2AEC|nr:tenascin-X-like isoform X3 [Oncorhynchus tshawytscha]